MRGLRRIVDALQRGLFDDEDRPLVPEAPVPGDLSRHPCANRELVLDGRRIAFLLKRSRRRSIGFVVGAEGLAVSAPKWVALREIDVAVREKGAWIAAKLAEQSERAARAQAGRIVWADGAELLFLGAPIRIALDARHGLAAGEVVLDGTANAGCVAGRDAPGGSDGLGEPGAPGAAVRRLRIGLPPGVSAERLRDAVQSWLQREARAVFEARCAHFADRLGVRVTRLSLSSASTRWGSANAQGRVRLHWRLIHYPLATIDYVVAHELAHLREMNHSPRFWNVVRSVVPDYEAARRRLGSEPLAVWE
ncbi:MAG: SprT family zinc-dependent metalloprotease [Caldimonas sp.]